MKLSEFRFEIKTKLTVATLIPLMVAIFFCYLAGIFILNAKVAGQAQEKVRNDLNVAREAYQNELSRIYDVIRFTSQFGSTAAAIDAGDRAAIEQFLAPVRLREHLDVMVAVDGYGRVIYRANNPAVYGDLKNTDQYVTRPLKGETVYGTTVIPAAMLAREGADLVRQARVAVRETPQALPSSEAEREDGLFLMVGVPVRDRLGAIVGAIYGGVLLNNNNALVDKIKGIVYETDKNQGKSFGSATIFLGDVRVATNVADNSGARAIGTKMSADVYKKVILTDAKWVGRAFVVNDWYLTAYQPIHSLQGVPIGALYVGMKENQYSSVKTDITLLLSIVVILSALIGVGVSSILGGRLAQPVKSLALLARRLAAGEREVHSDIASRDEIGDLAGNFNEMSQALREREDRIIELNRNLEQKVAERTSELEENNRLLIQTREELLRVEKLAAIGELAAGVAHEINNPMAIIRGNTELLQLSLPEDDPNREEVETIFAQVKRVERIVSNLLIFARRERRELGTVRLNALLHEIVGQIGYQVPLEGIEIVENYDADAAQVGGDSHQLSQVFTNLVVNAIQAMPKGGVLTVETARGKNGGGFVVRVCDTGEGIPPENLSQIFNPFFTTKRSGTGLGLSVTYGIVKEHGGSIEVENLSQGGCCFCVSLPE
ncbi:cache domain-containing protein [Geomesophilobacter sediminis]|uniref:histidine kinase n=1 Tax=Geomesophilobacter sediminis TaxID=2798584 RepID=A0A8J7M1N2_9BACT|nr:cache domain-containing protein [Geomesophilobacter sediminis]MBJ6726853.1 cache domain-containing protein [Geomesophilobacter sediminis]